MMSTRFLFLAVVTALLASPSLAWGELPFADGQRVLFLGDSITQDGRYVALAESYLWAAYPDLRLDVVGVGLSSETVSGLTEPVHPFPRPQLRERLARALDLTQPDWVVACYGMNDGIYHPADSRIIEAYREGLQHLTEAVEAHGAKLILLTPPSFDLQSTQAGVDASIHRPSGSQVEPYGYKNPYPKYDQTLLALGETAKSMNDHPAVDRVIDLHASTDRFLQQARGEDPAYRYGDGVHPPLEGHAVMALAVLEGLGCNRQDAQAVLRSLTGISLPPDQKAEPTSEQQQFRDRLFLRFSQRSAAYRKSTGFSAPFKVDAFPIDQAEAEAKDRAHSLKLRAAALIAANEVDSLADVRDAAMRRWDTAVQELEKLDRTETLPPDPILFIGSSSVRLWESIATDMAPYRVIRRGYGGARFSDLAVFAERLITPHAYRGLAVFAGNDILGKPEDPPLDKVVSWVRRLIEVSRRHNAEAPVFLIEVTPTPSRFEAWPQIREVNAMLRELALIEPGVYFVATAELYLDVSKKPRSELFREDRLHQNDVGYRLWSHLIRQRLDEVFRLIAATP